MSKPDEIDFKAKRDATVSGRIPGELADVLDLWCAKRYRKRSEVIGMVLSRVLEIVKREGGLDQAVEDFVRKLGFQTA
jgi:hypothetical protein